MTNLLQSEAEMPVALNQPLSVMSRRPPRNEVHTNGSSGNGVGDYRSNGHSRILENRESPSRSPWQPFLIGVAGGTASGKTSVCHRIMCKLGQDCLPHTERRVVTISSDSFYRVLTDDERQRARLGEFNFDHPDALDFQLILDTMNTLLDSQVARIPVYDFVTHARLKNEYIHVYPADVILFEGILVFYFPELRNLFKLKLFVDMDADTRLARRVIRDLKERGRELHSTIHQYTLFVKPAFEEFCQPTKKYADVIIPRGAENDVAINLIVQHIKEHLLPMATENGSPRRSMQDDSNLPLTNGSHKAGENGLGETERLGSRRSEAEQPVNGHYS